MEWLVIAALGAWIWHLSRRVDALSQQIEALARVIEAGLDEDDEAEDEEDLGEFVLNRPLPRDPLEPLLLDTPLPPPSNDIEEIEPELAPVPPIAARTPPPPRDDLLLEPLHEIPRSERPAAPARPPFSFEKFIVGTALPWMAATAIVVAVALLMREEIFTPLLRMIAGGVIGVILIIASVWVRQGGVRIPGIAHPLAAAVLAGAGAAAFYMVALAAHGYGFVDWRAAAALLVGCALLLVALSFAHGQALGVLAIVAALLAPTLTEPQGWPADVLTLYVGAVAASGFWLAWLRRWIWVSGAAIAGLYVWFAAAIASDEIIRAMILISIASLGAVALGLRRPRRGDTSWEEASPHLPAIAISIGSVLLLWAWVSIVSTEQPALAGGMLAGLLQVGLAAGAVRERVAHPAALVTSVVGLALGAFLFAATRERVGMADGFYSWTMTAAVLIGSAAVFARPDRHSRALIAGAGAIGATALLILAVFSLETFDSVLVWAVLFGAAVLMAIAAHIFAQDSPAPKRDWAVDFWAGSGALLVLIGTESLSLEHLRPTAMAAAALALALVFNWRGWRALGWGALTAAVLSLAHALSSEFTGATLIGMIPIATTLAVLLSAAGFLFAAARAAATRSRDTNEALGAGAVLMLLLGAFHGLRWIAAGGAGTPLDGFTESALNALTLIAAGFVVLPRERQDLGPIGRLRGHVLMGAGLLFAFVQFGLLANPWWGDRPASPLGPPLLNAQALAFAAPAAFAFAAAARLYGRQLMAGRIYAIAGGLFAALWTIAEIRRAFHGPLSASADVGVFEGHCYALAALLGAFAISAAARMRNAHDARRPFTHDLSRASRALAVGGIALAALFMLVLRHPWWGAQAGGDSTELSASLSILAQAAAVGLSLLIGRALSRGDGVERSRFVAASAAAVFAWSFGHAAIRWLHHRAAMDTGAPLSGLEGFGHALWPLLFVLGASALTARAPGRDTVRAYLYDLEALWGAAIWPALAWTALSLWIVFNPWIGFYPADAASPLAAFVGLFALALAAWFSAFAPQIPHIRFRHWFEIAARVACVGHIFVALSLIIRWLYQGGEMRAALEAGSLETWTYSAAWALFGAGVLGVGLMRKDATLRWCGIAVLLFTTGKVFVFDTARLDGVVRVGSLLALGAVLILSTLATKRFNRTPQN